MRVQASASRGNRLPHPTVRTLRAGLVCFAGTLAVGIELGMVRKGERGEG